MSNIRVIPPAVATTVKVNGRTYIGVPGTAQDVLDVDADMLDANGWTQLANGGYVGTTAQRPTTGLFQGMEYCDTTLGYVICYDGTSWRSMAGAAV